MMLMIWKIQKHGDTKITMNYILSTIYVFEFTESCKWVAVAELPPNYVKIEIWVSQEIHYYGSFLESH